MKEWGRLGAHGCKIAERYDTEALASAALHRQIERKRRRGYGYATRTRDALTILRLEDRHDE